MTFTVVFEIEIERCVVALLLLRSPAAIIRRIIRIVIAPVQSTSSFWRVFIITGLDGPVMESLEVRAPFITDADPAPSVSMVALRVLIVAAVLHRKPYAIKPGVSEPMYGANRRNRAGGLLQRFPRNIALITPAAFCTSTPETMTGDNGVFPTITQAGPIRIAGGTVVVVARFNDQTPKPLAG